MHENVNISYNESMAYSLFLCVQSNEVKHLEDLLNNGADPHMALYGVLPIYVAICHDKPDCAKVLSKYMKPGDMITSESLTCIQTCVRFERYDLFKYFLQFESFASLKKIYLKYKYYMYTFMFGDIVLQHARERIRGIEVLQMLRQFEQLLNADLAGCLAKYLYSAEFRNAHSVSGCGNT